MTQIRHKLLMLLFLTLLVGCDRVTKDAAADRLGDGTVVNVVGETLDLRYTENREIAFNLLRSIPDPPRTRLLQLVGTASILLLGLWTVRHRFTSLLEISSAGALLAGAIGNVSDRWLRGYVIDFLHLAHWPVFNVADICVTLGMLGLVVEARRRRAPPQTAGP
ncbi:MAG TPA: signal peptidase II [Polyangiaceae bacterium]|nr:signal peptidase II [Polyangiaceae bacterium]